MGEARAARHHQRPIRPAEPQIIRIRHLAAKHSDQTEAKALVEEIDTATSGDEADADA